ncbi:DUF3006 domain-containing protein [Aquibacillus rhizosphaerae]|uniref:DUF3006 domain-containing protein n=1 Tax=Aquibacillus rhizosphaerae TaxID=3051431 RepID=A0ABT7LAF5_9BACI|nr:DUF3006 domain-containing protein [Aquibacillus sp. LR5S19]MDL4842850.1 DUF3006 domain-containing protein [Aquibacillus sp. LR5S19]
MNKYIVDRIEGNIVVLLTKGNESVQKDVPIELFPEIIKEGDIVEKSFEGERLKYNIQIDETNSQRNEAKELLNKLKNKNN